MSFEARRPVLVHMDDMGESLPSRSELQHPSRDSYDFHSRLSTPRQSMSDFQPMSPPPPPPPPQPRAFDQTRASAIIQSQPFNSINESLPSSNSGSGQSRTSPVTPKPFLKRGSRREPSAIHRKTPSPTSDSLNQSGNSQATLSSNKKVLSASRPDFNQSPGSAGKRDDGSFLGETTSFFGTENIAKELFHRQARDMEELSEFEKLERIVAGENESFSPNKRRDLNIDDIYSNVKTLGFRENEVDNNDDDFDFHEDSRGNQDYYNSSRSSNQFHQSASRPVLSPSGLSSSKVSTANRWGAVTRPVAYEDDEDSQAVENFDNSIEEDDHHDVRDYEDHGHRQRDNHFEEESEDHNPPITSHSRHPNAHTNESDRDVAKSAGNYSGNSYLIRSGRLSQEGLQNKKKNNDSSNSFLAIRPGPAGQRPTSAPKSASRKVEPEPKTSSNYIDSDVDSLKKDLAQKAKELEEELKTYREENALLKQSRKQQEQALSEALNSKSEILKWAAEEKVRTEKWCEEQKTAALKERRAAAKYVRDARSKVSDTPGAGPVAVSVRREKAEIEGLTATVEKLKLELETTNKKHKLTVKRLQDIIKDQGVALSDSARQVNLLEKDKIALWAFLDRSGVRPPNSIRNARYENMTKATLESMNMTAVSGSKTSLKPASSSLKNNSGSKNMIVVGDQTLVEEVDVEDFHGPMIATTVTSELKSSRGNEIPNLNPSYDPTRYSPSKKKTSLDNFSDNVPLVSDIGNDLDQDDPRLSSSWQRSSRSSRASRYSDNSENFDDGYFENEHENENTSDTHEEFISNAHKTTSVSPRAVDNNKSSTSGGKSEEILEDGSRFIRYKNGTVKRIFTNGSNIIQFINGDIKKSDAKTGIEEYYYAEAKTTHTTYPDGRQVYNFPNGQIEHHFPNGQKEITFPDSTRKVILPDGVQECYFADGVRYREYPDGSKKKF